MNNPQPWWLTWPVAEVAAAIPPLFSNFPVALKEEGAMARILAWCGATLYRHSGGSAWDYWGVGQKIDRRFEDPDTRAIAEAIHALDRAGLLMRTIGMDGSTGCQMETFVAVGLTRLGMHVLKTNTVRQHLGLGDTSPTA